MRYDELSPLTSSTKGSSTDRSSTEGFTLLELLISLTLSALLLTVLSTGIHSAVQDWSHQDKKLDHQVDAALGFLQLEKALRSAYPHRYRNLEENRNLHFFEGTDAELSWVSYFSPGIRQGLTTWRVASSPREEGQSNIMITITPTYPVDPELLLEGQQAGRFTLIENSTLSIEYLEMAPNEPPAWVNHWSARERNLLPSAVRISLNKQGAIVSEKEWQLLSVIPTTQLISSDANSRVELPVFK